MKRIDVAATPDIFRRIGKLPIRRTLVTADRRFCDALMAHYFDAFGFIGVAELPKKALGRSMGLRCWYVSGLIWGWDGFDGSDLTAAWRAEATRLGCSMDDWRAGQADGASAWRACEDAGLVRTDSREELEVMA